MKNNCVKWIAGSFLFFVLVACESADPDLNEFKSGIEISFYDAACLEAWIYVDFSRNEPCSFRLDYDRFSREFELTGNDTILYIDSLSPGSIYQVNAWMWKNYSWLESGSAGFRTLEPTSHDFTWETHYPGDGKWSGWFNDIAIISENNIMSVGRFIESDDDGGVIFPYNNLAHWDGNKWEKKSLNFESYSGAYYPGEALSIQGLDDGTVLVSQPGNAKYYSGGNWFNVPKYGSRQDPCYGGDIIWGFAVDDFFIGGREGHLFHRKKYRWDKIETNVEGYVWEIIGYINKTSGKKEALVVSNIYEDTRDNILSKITEDNKFIPVHNNVGRLWTKSGHPIYSTNRKNVLSNKRGKWEKLENGPEFAGLFQGNDLNDLFCLSLNQIYHFNGIDWKTYYFNDRFSSYDIKGDMIVAETMWDSPLTVVVGRRKN